MAFDPSIISQIPDYGPDPIAARAKAYTLADLVNTQEMGKLRLNQARQDQADQTKARDILKTASYSTPDGVMKTAEKLTQAGMPGEAMKFMQTAQSYQSGEIERQTQQLQLAATQQDAIAGTLDNVYGQLEQMRTQGATPAMLDAAAAKLVIPAMQNLAQNNPQLVPVVQKFAQNPQNLTYNGIRSAEAASNRGQQMIKSRLDELKANTTAKTEEERERHDRELESQGREKVSQSQEKIDIQRGRDGGLTAESTDSLAEQAMAGDTTALTGLKPADKIKVRNRMADLQQIRGLTGADQAAANAQFAGVKAGERTLGTRQANIDMAVQEAQNIEPILREASAKVPRGGFVPWNKLFQIAEKGSSNKDLLAFAQAAKSFANIYTRATVPGASAVADREAAVEHLPIFTDDASFQAVLDIMDREMQAAKQSPGQVRTDMSRAITGRSEAPPSPGQTANPGAPPAGAASVGPKRITSDADYNALPSGSTFIAPDGTTRRKP